MSPLHRVFWLLYKQISLYLQTIFSLQTSMLNRFRNHRSNHLRYISPCVYMIAKKNKCVEHVREFLQTNSRGGRGRGSDSWKLSVVRLKSWINICFFFFFYQHFDDENKLGVSLSGINTETNIYIKEIFRLGNRRYVNSPTQQESLSICVYIQHGK